MTKQEVSNVSHTFSPRSSHQSLGAPLQTVRSQGRREGDGVPSPLPWLKRSLGPPEVLHSVLQVLMNRAPVAPHACDNQHNTPVTSEMEPVLGGPQWKLGGTGETQIWVLLPLLPAEAPVLCHRRARAPRSVFLTAQ